MFTWFKPKNDLINEKVTDQLSSLVHVRVCLTNLRANRTKQVIGDLEAFLDLLVTSLAAHMDTCKPTLKDLLVGELGRVCRYRKDNDEELTSYLQDVDESTRGRLLEMRRRAQATLEQFSAPP